jgi:hypothetical protein
VLEKPACAEVASAVTAMAVARITFMTCLRLRSVVSPGTIPARPSLLSTKPVEGRDERH